MKILVFAAGAVTGWVIALTAGAYIWWKDVSAVGTAPPPKRRPIRDVELPVQRLHRVI